MTTLSSTVCRLQRSVRPPGARPQTGARQHHDAGACWRAWLAVALLVALGGTAKAAPHQWINLFRGLPQPSNLALSGNAFLSPSADPAFALQLVDVAWPPQYWIGRAVVTRPTGVPDHGFRYFTATFWGLMYLGGGRGGFSFNYGPDENAYISGSYEQGTSRGLAISFVCSRDTGGYPDQCRIYYDGALVRSYGLDLWDGSFENQNLRMEISYGPAGLTVIVRTHQWANGTVLVNDVVASNLPIPAWAPRKDWKFFLAGASYSLGFSIGGLRIVLTDLVLTTDSEPPAIANLPTTVNGTEDTPVTVPFTVTDYEDTDGTVVTASSSNPGLVPDANIVVQSGNFGTVGGQVLNRRLAITPAADAHGTATITVNAIQDGDTTSRTFTLNISSVNDPPGLLMPIFAFMPEDTPVNTSFIVSDVDTPLANVTVSAVSSNPTLVPDTRIVISGSGSTRNLLITPMPHEYGEAAITLTANDGAGGVTAWTYFLHLFAVNDLPVADSRGVLHTGNSEAYLLGGVAGLTGGNAPHSIEAWVKPTVLPPGGAPQALLQVGATLFGGSHAWLVQPLAGATNTLRLQAGPTGRTPQVTDVPLPLGRWTHLAATWDGAIYSLYVNGLLAGQVQPNAGFALTSPTALIALNPLGEMDEVRLWNKALSEAEIRRGLNVPLTGLESDLVAYWRFDEGENLLAFDSAPAAGRSNLRLDQMGPGPRFAQRRDETGLILDGVDDVVEVPHTGVLNAFPLTVTAWVRTTDGSGAIINKYQAGSLNGYQLYVTGGRLRAWYFANALNYVWDVGDGLDAGPINDGQWHHVALTVDATGGRVYVDGTLRVARAWTGSAAAPSTTLPLRVGVYPGDAAYLACGVDEVTVWNRALSVEEIQALRYGPLSGAEAGLLAYYPFNEASGTTASNLAAASGVGHGLLRNGPARGLADPSPAWLTWQVNEETPTEIFLPGLDVELYRGEEGATLTYTIVTPPAHGTLTFSSGNWADPNRNPLRYTPAADYNGPDRFTYQLTDNASGQSQVATVFIEVTDLNDNPFISDIPNLVIEEGTATGDLPFTIGDPETPVGQLQLTAASSDTRLVPPANIVFGGAGSNRTVRVTPAPGEIGTVTIEITVNDPQFGLARETFRLRVEPRPAYALVDLGDLGLRNFSFGAGLNDRGVAVGRAQPQSGAAHALLNRGLTGLGLAEDIHPEGAHASEALAINEHNLITGHLTPALGQPRQLWLWREGIVTNLAGLILGGNDSIGFAINSSGDLVGSFRLASGPRRAFRLTSDGLGGYTFTNLGVLPGGAVSEALGVNNALQVVGYSTVSGGAERAFLHQGATMTNLGVLSGHYSSRAFGINNDGLVVGYSQLSAQTNSPRRAFVHNGVTMTDLGLLPEGNSAEGYAINDFGQVVGRADRRLGAQTTVQRAFLYTAGRMRDLNDLIHDSRQLVFAASNWQLEEARAINAGGAIVGTGTKDGKARAFLAVPAWVIGRQIARPEGAVARLPEIEILSGGPGDTPLTAFHWSEFERKLYAIRPVSARLRWFTSFTDVSGSGTNVVVNTDRIVVEGVSVWPKDPIVHVAETPVQVEPQGVAFNYTFQGILYDATGGGAQFEPTSKTFNSDRAGYAVLYYLKTDGAAPDPQTQRPHFDVVRTYRWLDAPTFRDNVPAVVGQKLTDPDHAEYLGRNGYVFYPNSFYDGAGADRAYDRSGRRGPIIPVNLDNPNRADDDLLVVWYRFNAIGVAWASVPVRYSVTWPADGVVDKIIIASQLGSGPLPSAQYPGKQVYHQPNPALPGYNPNEEHALIVDDKLFALRNDLNDKVSPKASEPYALLKYRDPVTTEWSFRVFKVVAEEAPWFFRYAGVAGTEIQPPLPLSALPLCPESYGSAGPWWEDWQGRLYARAAGPEGTTAQVRVRWFYPLQPGFFYDLNRDGTNDVPVGTCLAWLDRRNAGQLTAPNQAAGVAGTPMDVTYVIRWPETPVLQIGETLLDSKRGLPGVRRMASLQLIYDDLNPAWNPLTDPLAPLNSLARLYDPLSARAYRLAPGESIPTLIKRTNRDGKEEFDDLPAALKSRLRYDPVNRWLLFSGVLDDTVVGEPLLLPNVLTSRERDTIKALAEGDTAWAGIVDRLYDLTRNPNRVDLMPRDGQPDRAADPVTPGNPNPGLRLGLVTVGTNVVPERFGDLPKALTTAIGGVPPAPFQPGSALRFTATNLVSIPTLDLLAGDRMTLECWIKPTNLAARAVRTLLRQGAASPDWAVEFRNNGNTLAFTLHAGGSETLLTAPVSAAQFENQWRHLAAVYTGAEMRLYVDGRQVAQAPKTGAIRVSALGARLGVRDDAGALSAPFEGWMDEVRFWNVGLSAFQVDRDRGKWLFGSEDGLVRYYRCDDPAGARLSDATDGAQHGTLAAGAAFVPSDAPTGARPRFLTLAENNDPALAGLPIQLHIIRVDDGPFRGDLKVLPGENVFDQRLTLRHSSDFGGDPDPLEFEWYYKPDAAGIDPLDLPIVNVDGSLADARGWIAYTRANRNLGAPPPPALTSPLQGVNDITIGEGGESGLLTMSDNWFICRYRGYNIRGATHWSDWIGDPASPGQPRAMLAEGWIKRVIRGLNPFDQRVKDFHASPVNTFASMLVQAGARYEGDVAFNPSADNLNAIGLIEAYTTVLHRGRRLSLEGTPPVDFNPANNALLLVASRIADLYVLLGNEAYADAQDPTIGFGTTSLEYGTAASSIFAFQNQLDSLLEEELALLRGRDDRNAGVGGRPVYNRLFWNFTLGEGEVAYQQVYNISDQDFDGDVDEFDARILFPQGHGDAWGHYLTALKTYYELLRHPYFTWVPRTERVLVGGAPVEVDFLDERKFAAAAAAKARAGNEIVDLTYRLHYVEDPAGQWQGYKDRDRDRAWGVDEWARRAGQGAYFDWLTANAILPATDPNPNHTGIQKIDRQTVRELGEIAAAAATIQATLDKADAGLNPVGLAKGAVPFDIDPSEIPTEGLLFGRTHYEQVRDRAHKALNNAVSVFNEANRATQLLRQNQDTIDDLTRNVRQQELDFKNRLIEIYGYPYAGDIGPGKTYPSGYDGPDLYKFMYIDLLEITGERFPPAAKYTAFFRPVEASPGDYTFYTGDRQSSISDPQTVETSILRVDYPVSAANYGFAATPEMGRRRAPGELQFALQDIVRAHADLKVALQDYDGLLADISDALQVLQAQHNLHATNLAILNQQRNTIVGMNTGIGAAKAVELVARRIRSLIDSTTEITTESLPKVLGLANDVTAPARGIVRTLGVIAGQTADIAGDAAELTQEALSLAKEEVALSTEIELVTQSQNFEVLQAVKAIEAMVRNEAAQRVTVYSLVEQIRQLVGRYLALQAEGLRVQEQLLQFRRQTAADVIQARYQDMTFRIFRHDALRKYRAQFDLAARYVYLAATAYDYDSNLLGQDNRAGRDFLADIIRQRALGQVIDGEPVVGQPGLADPLARLNANYEVIRTQFGLNNPATETTRFSLRRELFRMADDDPDDPNDPSDAEWRALLNNRDASPGYKALRVDDLWQVPEFRRFCRPFAPEAAGPQPGLILRWPSTVTFGLNYFTWPLGGGDSAYDSSRFATRVRSVGIWFQNYDGHGLSQTPRLYLAPVGLDVLRSPAADDFATREWRVVDQALPVPFPIGSTDLRNPLWIPLNDTLGGVFAQIRRHSQMRAYHDSGFIEPDALTTDTRLIGRSVWNTDWMMIIPGGTFLADGQAGLDAFIAANTDILILLQSYSYSGN